MKRWISVFLVLSLAFVLLSAAASAETPDEGIGNVKVESAYSSTISIKVDSGKEKLDITYSGAQSGCYYLVLCMSDDSGVPTESNLVYIDQISASGSSVKMTVYPSQLEAKTYYIYMSSNASSGITKLVKVASFVNSVPFKKGDVNMDGAVGADDALLVLRAVAGFELTATQKALADMNDDGSVGSDDALLILKSVAGS